MLLQFIKRVLGLESKELMKEINVLSMKLHTDKLIFQRIEHECEFYINANDYSRGKIKGQYTNLQRCGLRKIQELVKERG